jgi:hypothetical protein
MTADTQKMLERLHNTDHQVKPKSYNHVHTGYGNQSMSGNGNRH